MCGIVGWFSKEGVTKDQILLAGVNTQTRGMDGSGVWTIESGLVKHPDTFGNNFYDYMKILPEKSCLGLLHDRMMTNGGPTSENTHPFILKDWVLVHNGIVTVSPNISNKAINNIRNVWTLGQTDTEKLLVEIVININAKKMEPNVAIKNVMENTSGSYSCFLINKITREVYFWSNNARFFAKIGNTMWFFSTKALFEATITTDVNKYSNIDIEKSILYKLNWDTMEFEYNKKIEERTSFYGYNYTLPFTKTKREDYLYGIK